MNDTKEEFLKKEFEFDDIQITLNKNKGIKIRAIIIKTGLIITIILIFCIIILLLLIITKKLTSK